MSLIICSNKEGETNYNNGANFQRPYSFVNNLKQTLKIAKNSEVAVQSVKLTRNGLIELNSNDIFYQWFGPDLQEGSLVGTPQQPQETTCYPILCSPDMSPGKTEEYVNLTEFNRRMEVGMNFGMPHPDIFGDGNGADSHIKCNILRTGGGTTGQGFEGFNLQYKNGIVPVASAFNDADKFQAKMPLNPGITATALTPSTNGIEFKNTNTDNGGINNYDNVMWGYDKPISHNGGNCTFDLKGQMADFAGGDYSFGATGARTFQCGLARYNSGAGTGIGAPSYMSNMGRAGIHAENFYDYGISCEQTSIGGASNWWLRAYQFKETPAAYRDPNAPCSMEEIEYYSGAGYAGSIWTGGSQNGRYNMSSNALSIQKVEFLLENEKMIITLIAVPVPPATEGVRYILASYNDKAALGANKNNYPVPMRQSNWNMYPKVMITTLNSTITLEHYYGRVMKLGNTTFRGGDERSDWFNRLEKEGVEDIYGLEVDSRFYMDFDDLSNEYVQLGNTGAGVMTNYNQVVILNEDNVNYIGTYNANMAGTLGFDERSILDWADGTADTARGIQYKSDNTPVIVNENSLFIRLNNFTQRTINAGTGRPSKILYHIPRFDSSGRDNGYGLYFEPHERVYIKLNNSEEELVNEFALDICQDSEILAEDLLGETIICLHVRESK